MEVRVDQTIGTSLSDRLNQVLTDVSCNVGGYMNSKAVSWLRWSETLRAAARAVHTDRKL